MSAKYVFVSAYIDPELYHRCVSENPFIRDNEEILCVGLDNTTDNQYISKRYNQFLNSWDYEDNAWFIFCHSDWEVLEDIAQKLQKLNRNTLYGPIGAIVKKGYKKLINEYRGYCRERSRDGFESRILACKKQKTGTLVDTLDAQCIIMHSSLVKRYNLRFDESYAFDLYCEDFSANAKTKYDIKTRILRLECRHNNIAKNMDGREAFYPMLDIFNNKYPDRIFGGVVTLLGKTTRDTKYVFPEIIEAQE